MLGLRAYLMVGAVAAATALAGWGWWGWQRVEHWRTEAEAAQAQLRSCRASITLLREEIRSDAEVDVTPDSGLSDLVDPRWLLAPRAK